MMIQEFTEGNRLEAQAMLQRYTSLSSGEIGQLLNEGQRLVALQGEQVCGFAALTPGHPGFYSLAVLVEPAARVRELGVRSGGSCLQHCRLTPKWSVASVPVRTPAGRTSCRLSRSPLGSARR